MIRIIVVVMNSLIKRKFCHAALESKHETLQSEPSGRTCGEDRVKQ